MIFLWKPYGFSELSLSVPKHPSELGGTGEEVAGIHRPQLGDLVLPSLIGAAMDPPWILGLMGLQPTTLKLG